MKYALSLSYGKDSLRMIECVHKNNLPLDRIVTCDIYSERGKNIHNDEMLEFEKKADKFILDRYGIVVEHISNDKSYDELIRSKVTSGIRKGQCRGFSLMLRSWCQRDLKVSVINKATKGYTNYVGYAYDEKNEKRQALIKNRPKNIMYPLADFGITEEMAMEWCKENDLVAPTYKTSKRDGCWFCGKQPINQLRILYNTDQEKWNKLLEWDSLSTVKFKPDGHTVHDLTKRFEMENKGLVPIGNKFRWKMIK